MNSLLIKKFLLYQLKAKNAHALHSPFVYSFYNDVLRNTHPFYSFSQLNSIRYDLLKNTEVIESADLGAGSKVNSGTKKRIKDIALHGITQRKYAELLFRMIQHFNCRHIVELGTSIGLTTLYLSRANSDATVTTFEGNPHLVRFAKKLFSDCNQTNIRIVEGNMDQTLEKNMLTIPQIDFFFVDGNHKKEPTLRYFEIALKKAHSQSVFVFDDIHWSAEMSEAWEIIQKHPSVKLSIDIFQFGIVFFRKEHLNKESFTLRF